MSESIGLEVLHRLVHDALNESGAALDLSHQHGALYRCEAEVGELILSRAADHDIDLIVMGLCGRSRVREVILGDAS